MDLALYEKFKIACKSKVKADEKRFAAEFVQSFRDDDERLGWAKGFLETVDGRQKIRHELYEGIVFPALLAQYRAGSVWAGIWLARTFGSIVDSDATSRHFEGVTQVQLYEECLAKDPSNDQVRMALVDAKVESMEYAVHAWPRRVIYAEGETSVEFLAEVARSREQDKESRHTAFFDRVEKILLEDRTRVKGPRAGRS
ncbi:MAG: hypothetical protein IPO40_00025 [Fibrobacteres bacterium]|nr:hypothetical protein [Fibrobacterota bacterium]